MVYDIWEDVSHPHKFICQFRPETVGEWNPFNLCQFRHDSELFPFPLICIKSSSKIPSSDQINLFFWLIFFTHLTSRILWENNCSSSGPLMGKQPGPRINIFVERAVLGATLSVTLLLTITSHIKSCLKSWHYAHFEVSHFYCGFYFRANLRALMSNAQCVVSHCVLCGTSFHLLSETHCFSSSLFKATLLIIRVCQVAGGKQLLFLWLVTLEICFMGISLIKGSQAWTTKHLLSNIAHELHPQCKSCFFSDSRDLSSYSKLLCWKL